jgi:hypothetical protein
VDFTDIDLGSCDMWLGWGLVGDACAGISGCGCEPYCDFLFSTQQACNAACL